MHKKYFEIVTLMAACLGVWMIGILAELAVAGSLRAMVNPVVVLLLMLAAAGIVFGAYREAGGGRSAGTR